MANTVHMKCLEAETPALLADAFDTWADANSPKPTTLQVVDVGYRTNKGAVIYFLLVAWEPV